MRFKKGSKVEVLSKKDVPSGSWRCAEIICGNGHNYYIVRYDGLAGNGDERVSRMAIRPCPPPLPEAGEIRVIGDVIEVFNDFSWKMGTISQILGKNFMVRLLGSSLEFKVSKFDIRTRQSWQDRKWVTIGKGSEDRKQEHLTLKCNRNSRDRINKATERVGNGHLKNDCSAVINKEELRESKFACSTTLKRQPLGDSHVEAYGSAAHKLRAIEKEGRVYRAIVINQFPEHVDAVGLPREILGGKFMQFSSNSQSHFSEVDAGRKKPIGDGCPFARRLKPNDADSDTCSVGSCSITSKNFFKLQSRAFFIGDNDGCCSDVESFCELRNDGGNSQLPKKEELAAEIHRLELHAYRCTIEALHASGPLSWEQEALVTNLRLSLHISNDEHLMEGQNRRLSDLFELLKDDVGVCYLFLV